MKRLALLLVPAVVALSGCFGGGTAANPEPDLGSLQTDDFFC